MARTDNLSNFLTDVASAIKTKKGSNTAIPAANFDTEISNLPSQGTYQTKSITINSNGNTSVTPDQGYDAIDQLNITTNVSTTDPEYAEDLSLSEDILGIEKPYVQLEYIQSQGDQYINTGIYAKNTTGIDMKFNEITTSPTAYAGIFGGRTTYYTNGFTYFNTNANSAGSKLFQMGDTQATFSTNWTYCGIDVYLQIKNGVLAMYGNTGTTLINQSYTHANASTQFTTVYPMYLFAVNDHGITGGSQQYNLKVYYFKVYDGEELIQHLIPVKRKSDNEICMYDLVTEQFFTNIGTGSFVAGPEMDNFDELEYIESNGGSYTILEHIVDTNSKIDIEFAKTGAVIDWERLLGTRLNSSDDSWMDIMRNDTSNEFYYRINDTGTPKATFTISVDTKHHLILTNSSLTFDGVTTTFTAVNYTAKNKLRLFQNLDRTGVFKLYSMKVYRANSLALDLIPVKRKSDNVVCLYDKITQQFYINKGSGSFVAGPVKS